MPMFAPPPMFSRDIGERCREIDSLKNLLYQCALYNGGPRFPFLNHSRILLANEEGMLLKMRYEHGEA